MSRSGREAISINNMCVWPIQGRALPGLCLFAAATLCATHASSQSVSIESGAQFSLGAGSLSAGCGDLSVAGSLSLGSGAASGLRNVIINSGTVNGGNGSINLSGDWLNQGTFAAQSSTVNVTDRCGTSTTRISGDSTFNQFIVATGSGKRLEPAAGSRQTFTGGLSLTGSGADRLLIRTSSPGSTAAFVLNQGASQTISGVDVQDIDSSAGETIAPSAPQRFNSVDSGNNTNWFIAAIEKIPVKVDTLPAPLLAILALLILIMGSKARMPAVQRVSSE